MGHSAGRGATGHGCATLPLSPPPRLRYCWFGISAAGTPAKMSSATLAEEARASHQPMGLTEFVVFASSAMAINALAVSIMLAALPQIAAAYALQNANAQQLVLTIFFVGFSLGQFVVGPISDRFGRRNVLLAGLALYSLASLVC